MKISAESFAMIFTFNQLNSDANRVARMPLGALKWHTSGLLFRWLAEKNRAT